MIKANKNAYLPAKADFPRKLWYLMERDGYSAERLGREISTDPKTIRRWLNGELAPRIESVRKLTAFFNVNGSWLTRRE